jgi:oligoendopeptidase F
MDVLFPGLDSAQFEAALQALAEGLSTLQRSFDSLNIRKGNTELAGFDDVLSGFNQLMDHARLVNGYVSAIVTTDSRNQLAQARASEIENLLASARKLGKRLTAWLGGLDVDALLRSSELAREHEYALRKAVIGAQRLMTDAEESLSSDLEVTGKNAWSKLHSNVTSQLMVPLSKAGEREKALPMSSVRALAYDADREVRLRAYQDELEAWKSAEVPLAAALNSIKGCSPRTLIGTPLRR